MDPRHRAPWIPPPRAQPRRPPPRLNLVVLLRCAPREHRLFAGGHVGGVRMAKLDGGGFGFKAAASTGDTYDATVTKALKQTQYDLAVLEISAPIQFDGLFDVPNISNVTKLLEKAGCKRFAALVAGTTGVLAAYQAAITLFAPNDDAFLAKGAPNVDKMPHADLVAQLLYHAVPSYIPRASLKLLKSAARPLRTLASTKSRQ